jgi:aryl-alcohol dehydrogenase-like predicted oxidoreductase
MEARRPIGSSGIEVHPIGYGAMSLSTGERPADGEALAVLEAAFDAGVELIDTADAYCRDEEEAGHNERLIARALRGSSVGRAVVVATKGGAIRPAGAWKADGSAAHLHRACERSLRNLRVDTIDLYQLHTLDRNVPLRETAEALAGLREQGKVRHVGLSNVTVAQIDAVRSIVPVVSVQNRAGVLDRSAWSMGVAGYCERHGLALLPYSPLGGRRGVADLAAHPALNLVASRHGVSPHRVALAWLLARSPAALPIPGGRRVASVRDSASAAGLALDDADLAELDAAFPIPNAPPAASS